MNVSPNRLADAIRRRDDMLEALGSGPIDMKKLVRAIVEDVTKVEYVIGIRYRMAVLGSTPILNSEALDENSKPIDVVERVGGMKFRDMLEAGIVRSVAGVYRGRVNQPPANPHVFRMADGLDAVLADMDILAWERA